MPAVTSTQRLYINILIINVCGLKSKLLLRDFMIFNMNHDVVCMCETRCINNVVKVMENCGFDIV